MEDMIPLNGLRGICAAAIVLGHQSDFILKPTIAGQSVLIGVEYLQAVSLFFLLSGIPLIRIYGATGKVSTWSGSISFWRKRCARLMPIYYLTLVLNLLVYYIITQQFDFREAMTSFVGCLLMLQAWFVVQFINVGGVLWQVAVFMFGYLLFPSVSRIVCDWKTQSLYWGIASCWLFSLILWFVYGAVVSPALFGWWIWHAHALSRLPHFLAGVLLGQIVEQKRNDVSEEERLSWGYMTDILSLVLVGTAIQAPIVQWYCGSDVRSSVSVALEAWLLPLHAAWLGGILLSYKPMDVGDVESQHGALSNNINDESNNGTHKKKQCWTRRVLSFQPLIALGDISLVLYCLHLVVMFLYTSTYAYISTGSRYIWRQLADTTMLVQVPWYHAPIQWFLILAVTFAVSKWYEAPLRRILSGGSNRGGGVNGVSTQGDSSKETSRLLPSSGRVEVAYGGDT